MIRKLNNAGSVLISMVLIFPFFILIITAHMNQAVSGFQIARKDQFRTLAQFGADAGIDKAVKQINADIDWTGSGGEVEVQNNATGKVTYETTVTDQGEQEKLITSIGRTYRSASSASPESEIKIAVDVIGIQSQTQSFSVVTGVGGLQLYNNSKILGGDVLVNGSITMTNGAQIGLETSPVNLSVAHQNCPNPPDSTYPKLCGSGENGEPITLHNNSHIYGDVKANNQVSAGGMSDPGLTASSGVEPADLPPHDRDAQKAAVANEMTGSEASCWGSNSVTWPANVKITGNVNLSNSCDVTVLGDAWITGTFNMSNSTEMIISNTVGTDRPDIMIDGKPNNLSNSSEIVSNDQDTGAQFITYWSSASCSPDCADVTGSELANSRNTVTLALSNSASGAHSIFYAKWSKVQLSNSGQIGALVGQTITLSNSSAVTFGTSTGGEGSSLTFWLIDGYRRSF